MRGGFFFLSGLRGKRWTVTAEQRPTSHIVHSSRVGNSTGSDPVRPCVFWVITGFGIPSAGRGHAVETGVLEPVPRWGPILLLLLILLRPPHPSPLTSFTLSVSALPHLLRRFLCVFQLVRAKPPLPLRNSPRLFLLSPSCSFISCFFFFFFKFLPRPSRFLYRFHLIPQTLLLPHVRLYAALMPHNWPESSPL